MYMSSIVYCQSQFINAGLDIKLLYPLALGASRFEKLLAPKKFTGPNIVNKHAATEVPIALEDQVLTGVTS